jgi:hypothetical protein
MASTIEAAPFDGWEAADTLPLPARRRSWLERVHSASRKIAYILLFVFSCKH